MNERTTASLARPFSVWLYMLTLKREVRSRLVVRHPLARKRIRRRFLMESLNTRSQSMAPSNSLSQTIPIVTLLGSEDIRLLSPTRILECPGESLGLVCLRKRGKQDASCL